LFGPKAFRGAVYGAKKAAQPQFFNENASLKRNLGYTVTDFTKLAFERLFEFKLNKSGG